MSWNRREILRAGLLGGSFSILPSRRAVARSFFSPSSTPPPSPPATPFVAPLTLPPLATPVAPFVPVDASLPPQSLNPPTYYHLFDEQRFLKVHPQYPPTKLWGYRDANVPAGAWPHALGPTFIGEAQKPLFVRHTNILPANHVGFGVPEMTVHLHGGHHEARSDGFPGPGGGLNPVFGPGQSYDYAYPLLDPGFTTGQADATDRPSTLWYHDHLLDFTGQNVYRGLAGFFLFKDAVDAHDENLNDGVNLRLPSGEFDVPMIVQDKRFDSAGQLVLDVFNHDGFLGDKYLVNGTIQPYMDVKRRKYRLRLLAGTNARFFAFRIVRSNGQPVPFDLIATEGGLMSAPIRNRTTIFMGPAERFEIVVNFAAFAAGELLYLENRARQDDGRGPNGTLDPGQRVLQFRVGGGAVADPSRVPDVLRPFAAITQTEINAATRRTFVFKRRHGAWVINDEFVDLNRSVAGAVRNTPEIWKLVNNSGGWWHPIHVHLEFMHVLKRNGILPPLEERDGRAKKDVINLGPNETVEVFFNFRDFPGPWAFHCHNLEHEDAFMMARFDVL